ncbi:MAG: DUF1592 domain-containing protein [Pirellulaceae bacterium]|nr:DUF1592 domain-containing protein [Pirellulaceae bacterium]
MSRNLVVAMLLVAGSPLSVVPLPAAAAPPDEYAEVIRPLLAKHCLGCHGENKQEAGLRYDKLTGFRASDRHLWTLVHQRLVAGEMPPEGNSQPTADEKKRLLLWIEAQQRAARVGGTRRLNRRELAAALRDVTGLAVDFAAGLPGDGQVDGFDTGAAGLQDAADSVSQIMQVTRQAVDGLRFLDPAGTKIWRADLLHAKDARQAFEPWKVDGLSTGTGDTVGRPGTGLLIKPRWLGERGGLTIRVPVPVGRPGVLRVKAVVSVQKFVAGVPNPMLWVEVGGRDLEYQEINRSPENPHTIVHEVQLADLAIDAKGLEITLCNRVEMPYEIAGFDNEDKSKPEDKIPGGTGLFRPVFDRAKLPIDQQPTPFIVLHTLEIDADYRAAWPPTEWNANIGELRDDRARAERLLALWMDRAFRRPSTGPERQRFMALYLSLREQGLSFDDALRATFQSVLLSGSFRYLATPADAPTPAAAQHALASRLSFMLWGAPPDQDLRDLALAGKLRDPAVLDAQVERLLGDPRSAAFMRPFVMQWLEMGQPITVAMDHIQKQDFRFGRHLKASMQDETIAYFGRVLAENRPTRELFASDWTMMNDILARHYGYSPLEGARLRPVTLRSDDPRGGGLLGQAGIQSMLCWMGENWVIYRGAWTLRHLLDAPPPPPPLEVPELLPSDAGNHGKSFRELLKQHQEDQRCAVCHKTMDPLGFAFQNFDLSGRWRDVEHHHYIKNDLDGKIEWRGSGATRPVDAAGQLPRGEHFASFAECKQLLVQHYTPDLARGLLKSLVLYGTGRKPEVDDLAEIRSIQAQHEPAGYPLKSLLKALVRSRTFTEK